MLGWLAVAVLAMLSSSATVGTSTLHVPCGAGIAVAADWHKPSGTPTGLVWLQHGYLGSRADVADLGRNVAARTGALVVAPSLPSSGACWIDGTPMHQAVAALFTNRAALQASAQAAGFTGPLPTPFVLAGHSSGGNLSVDAARYLAAGSAFADLRGVVMFDGAAQDPAMTQMRQALPVIAGKPVLQVGAPATVCNPDRRGTRALVESRPGEFVGVELVNGSHMDAVGYANFWGNVFCGFPRVENVAAVQTIAVDWIGNMLTGSSNGITGGTPGQQVPVGSATAVVL